MYSVLLIDDDGKLGAVLTEYCARFSIALDLASTPNRGFALLSRHDYDMVILDVMLPEMDGFDVLRRLRQHSDVPVIMLTARGDVTDRIVGLEIGADDYLPKPFDPRELVARLLANIKRHRASRGNPTRAQTPMHFKRLSLFPESRQVRVDGEPVDLTAKEYALLMLLAAEPGKTFSRDEILSRLKGTDNELYSRSVDILVSRLRAKLKPASPISTVHGEGYAFTACRRHCGE